MADTIPATPQNSHQRPSLDEKDVLKALELKDKLSRKPLTNTEALVLHSLQKSEESQRREERSSRRIFFVVSICAVLLLAVLFFFFYYMSHQDSILSNTVREFTYVNHQFAMKDLGYAAQKEVHRKHMMRIFSVHGFVYDKKEVKAFSKEQKVEVIELCFNLTLDLRKWGVTVGFYDGVTTGVLETSLNPNAEGSYSEKGYLQFKWMTAVTAYALYLRMPEWFQKKYKIQLTSSDDLFNPVISTVLYYVLYANLLKQYRGSMMWAMSEYHWGAGFLGNTWRKGKGDLPASITLNDIKYQMPAYYMNWISLKESFEAGLVEEGKPFTRKWQAVVRRILREEVRLNNSKNIIKKLRNEKRDIKLQLKLVTERVAKWDKKEEEAYEQFKLIYREIAGGKYKKVKKIMKKDFPVVKEWVEKYEKAHLHQRIVWTFITGLAALLLLVLIFFIIKWAVLYRISLYAAKQRAQG